MSNLLIRAVETNETFSVHLDGSEEASVAQPHDADFPAFDGEGYDEEIEIDEPQWDEVEPVFDGCPDGYVVVVFKLKERPIICMLYGPSGFVAAYGSVPEAVNAARPLYDNKPRSGGGGAQI